MNETNYTIPAIMFGLYILIVCAALTTVINLPPSDNHKILYAELSGRVTEESVKETVKTITEAGLGDTIVVRIRSEGGYVYAAERVLYAMDHSRARVKVLVDLYAASAAAYLFSHANDQEVSNNAIILYHRPSKCVKRMVITMLIPFKEEEQIVCTKLVDTDNGPLDQETLALHKKLLKEALDKHIIDQNEYNRVEKGEDVEVLGSEINRRIASNSK